MAPTRHKQATVGRELASVINRMRKLLHKEFGADHAYTISGRGNVVSASNLIHGNLPPKPVEEPEPVRNPEPRAKSRRK